MADRRRNIGIPAGVVFPFAGTVAPYGYLLCNGDTISRAEYPQLFLAIGTSHGIGDGSTTFNLPDYRGRFLRGVDGDAERDLDKGLRSSTNGGNSANAVGSVQGDSVQSHSHHYVYRERDQTRPSGSTVNQADSTGFQADSDLDRIRYFTETSGPTGNFSTESRPKNINVNYIIKI